MLALCAASGPTDDKILIEQVISNHVSCRRRGITLDNGLERGARGGGRAGSGSGSGITRADYS